MADDWHGLVLALWNKMHNEVSICIKTRPYLKTKMWHTTSNKALCGKIYVSIISEKQKHVQNFSNYW